MCVCVAPVTDNAVHDSASIPIAGSPQNGLSQDRSEPASETATAPGLVGANGRQSSQSLEAQSIRSNRRRSTSVPSSPSQAYTRSHVNEEQVAASSMSRDRGPLSDSLQNGLSRDREESKDANVGTSSVATGAAARQGANRASSSHARGRGGTASSSVPVLGEEGTVVAAGPPGTFRATHQLYQTKSCIFCALCGTHGKHIKKTRLHLPCPRTPRNRWASIASAELTNGAEFGIPTFQRALPFTPD